MRHARYAAYVFVVTMLCVSIQAQSQYKVLWTFAGGSADGATPLGNLILDRLGNLYGTTYSGGNTTAPPCSGAGCGTVFQLSPNPDGTWTNNILYAFCANYSNSACLDGAFPHAGLLIDGNGNLYGTTTVGGNGQQCGFGAGCGGGTVFKLSPSVQPTESWTQTILYDFCTVIANATCLDGAVPLAQLKVDHSGNFYGTTSTGGTGGISGGCCLGGPVFELTHGKSGWNESVLYNFCPSGGPVCPDGVGPQAGVTFDKLGNLYGTTEGGGASDGTGAGVLHTAKPNPNGWAETVLLVAQRNNAAEPLGTVSLDTFGRIYGTFSQGGTASAGGLFRYIPGVGKNLFDSNGSNCSQPLAGVLVDSQSAALYRTTFAGGGLVPWRNSLQGLSSPERECSLQFLRSSELLRWSRPSDGHN